MLLVQQSVRLMHSVQSLWARISGQTLSANALRALDGPGTLERLRAPAVQMIALTKQAAWHVLREQIDANERYISTAVPDRAGLARLRTAPGIGAILGLTALLETGPISRSASIGDYASYGRLVESRRERNGKKKSERNRRCRNRYLAWAYVEAANFAVRYSEQIRRWYQRKVAKTHPIIATKATAQKIARG